MTGPRRQTLFDAIARNLDRGTGLEFCRNLLAPTSLCGPPLWRRDRCATRRIRRASCPASAPRAMAHLAGAASDA